MRSSASIRRQKASILLLGVAISLVLLLTMAAAVKTTFALGRNVRYELDRTGALSIAEGVAEAAQKRLQEQIANFEEPDLEGVVTLGGEEYSYELAPIGDPAKRTASDGVVSNVQRYNVTTTVKKGAAVVVLDRVVDISRTPLFQFMIYYAGDLELLPGPSMTLSGRVHANGDIYVGCGNTLTVDTDSFQCTGSVYRRRKNDGSESTGTVGIKVRGQSAYKNLLNEFDAEYSEWTTYALETWNGTVQDGSHGVREVAAPEIGTIKAYKPDGSKGYYHEHAGLVIVDDEAYDTDGNAIDLSAAIAEKTMYDAREGKDVRVTEIDLKKLDASGHFPANGLIYAFRTDASTSQPNGIRLANGEELTAPMTLVTEDPLYVQGDFNTVNKKGAAVMADAVNLLSNSWSESGGTMQNATETTYNLAFVTGIVPTPDGGGPYSGGFENLPRFHERWTGVKAHINGAFINLFESEIAASRWGMSGVYRPPLREWRYDPDLNDPANLPPFTPSAVASNRLLWDDRLPLPFATN